MPENPHLLLPSQKKRALEICREHGIPSTSFRWDEVRIGSGSSPLVSKLIHKETEYYYIFDFYPDGDMKDLYSPAELKPHCETERHDQWDTRWQHVTLWASCLARELNALEFLSIAMVSAPTIQRFTLESDDNTPFNDCEREKVIAKLSRVEELIFESREFADSEAVFVRRQFDQLRSDASSAGRRSWFQMTVGVMVSVLAAFFDVESAKEIWAFLNLQFSELLRLTAGSK